MIFKMLLKCFVIAIVGVMVGCTSPLQKGLDLGDPAPISKAPPPASVSQGDDIKVIAMPLKQTVELGEPVYLALRVVNEGQEPVRIIGGLRPGEGLIEIYSIDAKGEKVILPPIGESDFEGTISLSPKQTIGDVFPIFFGTNGWNFTKAGEYRIFALLKVSTKGGFLSHSSEPAVLKVESSKAGQMLFSGDERSNIEAGKYLLWRSGDHLEAGIELLTSISKQHPNSVLSSYILVAHAQNFSEPFANYKVGKVRAPDCQKADLLRKMVDPKVLTENLLIEDYICQAKCHAERQDWEKAKNALDAGSKLSAARPEFMMYSQSIRKMQERLKKYIE